MNSVLKKKSFILSAFFLAAILLSSLFSVGSVFGEEALDSPIKASYYKFDGVTAVAGDGNFYAVGDANGLHVFGSDNALRYKNTDFSAADELQIHGGKIYILSQGNISVMDAETGETDALAQIETTLSQFTVFNGKIYAAADDTITVYDLGGAATGESFTAKSNVLSLSAADGKLFYSVRSAGVYVDIYELGADKAAYAKLRSDGKITGCGKELFTVTRAGEFALVTDAGAHAMTDGKFVTDVCGGDNGVYYATDIGEIYLYYSGEHKLLSASESDAAGFYCRPSSATARMGKLYVCDTLNDRIAVVGGDGLYSYIEMPRPLGADVNDNGELVAANGGGKISVFDRGYKKIAEYELPAPAVNVQIGLNNAVFALSGSTLYRVGNEINAVAEGVSAFSLSTAGDVLYLIKNGNSVYSAPVSAPQELTSLFETNGKVSAICADSGGNYFYAVNRGGSNSIIRRTSDGEELTLADDTIGNDVISVRISKTDVGEIKYGDLIIADSDLSLVHTIGREQAGVIPVYSSEPDVRPFDEENVLRKTVNSCSVYSSLTETEVKLNIASGVTLVVAKYDVVGAANFCYVFYEEPVSGTPVYGYVFKSVLSAPLPSNDPPAASGKVYSAGANLYELPSLKAEKVIESVPKNTDVELLPFADYEANGNRWYRVRTLDGAHGYMPTGSVSVRDFVPDDARPQYNAEIKSYRGSIGAYIYAEENGKHVKIDGFFLTNGTKIEVVGSFDTSEKYTKIKFFDDKLGTLTCYVETVYVAYNNISVVQIIAIVIAVITFILLVILLVRLYMKRRKL